ncbi:unnamed protein product [Cladocopium goreaui]|uniref:Abhydrolase domain-containing protein 8 n=1 Tax=Cladocopium goreaui TaxID=2562237 RepID=A0A9P1CK17_9DINO|nr:unnamed protein product [Cladocopium goreaui]
MAHRFERFSWRSGQELLKKAKIEEVRPGRKLRVLRQEPTEKMPTLLLVHGSAASLTQYLPLAAALNETLGYGIVCYDWLGCGGSEKPDDWYAYAFDELLKDLIAIWQDLRWPGPYIVVGHSFGSHLVLRLAASSPSMTGLVLLGAAKRFPEGHPIFRLPVFLLRWLQPTLTKAFLEMALVSKDPELIRQETDACNANPMSMCKAYYRQVRNATDAEIAECSKLRVLLIRGDGDGIVSASDMEALAQALPKSTSATVANAGHVPMLEEPGRVAVPWHKLTQLTQEKVKTCDV